MAASSKRSSVDGGVSVIGVPAESSMSIFQRRSSAVTRRARSRSGVTRAAVRPASFSVSRKASATTSASWWGVAQSARVTCSSADKGGRVQSSLVSAGRISSLISRWRAELP